MTLAAPTILLPYEGLDFSTNINTQILSGTAPVGTTDVYVNADNSDVTFTLIGLTWSCPVTLVDGLNTFIVQAYDTALGLPTQIVVNFLSGDISPLAQAPPFGVTLRVYANAIEVVVEEPIVQNVAYIPHGYNYYYSQTPGFGYTLLNPSPIRTPTQVVQKVLQQTEDLLPEGSVDTFSSLSGNFLVQSTVVTRVIQEVGKYIFRHETFSSTPLNASARAFYTVTQLAFDDTTKTEIESRYSDELSMRPITIDTSYRNLPDRTEDDIEADYINYVFDTDPTVDLAPGSVIQDLYIKPFASEVAKLRFLNDFRSRCQSFDTLIQLDDADNDAVSDPVSSSSYKLKLKISLGVEDNSEVQRVVDEAFDKLASNFNVQRFISQNASGYVVFYSPDLRSDVFISKGTLVTSSPDPNNNSATFSAFRVQVEGQMLYANKEDYYNPNTARYELRLPAVAELPGSQYNVGPEEISNITSGAFGATLNTPNGVTGSVAVTNPDSMRFGTDTESNRSLADRARFAWVGVDSGSDGGYIFDTLAIPAVKGATVAGGGHPLMVRDILDDGRHVWGTVDIHAQGTQVSQISESFPFANPILVNSFFSVQSSTFFQIGTDNPNISEDNPIFEVTRVTNNTRGFDYDLTGLAIIGGTVIDLDEFNATNMTIGICSTDIIRVDFSYHVKGKLIFSFQPVVNVISVVGDLSGDLTGNYSLFRNSHPLFEGRSNRAGDYLEVFFDGGIPLGTLQTVSDDLIMLEEFPVSVSKVGVLAGSVVVKTSDELITYTKDIDYSILEPTDVNPKLRIRRIPAGVIANGESVKVTYECGENIVVTYSYNSVPLTVIDSLVDKHIDADVLVKSVLESPIDIDVTVVKKPNQDSQAIDKAARKAISFLFTEMRIGDSLHESDVIAKIDDTAGVDFVPNPIRKLNRAEDALVLDEQIPSVTWVINNTDIVTSYKTAVPVLQFKTVDKGGYQKLINGGPGIEYRVVGIRHGSRFYKQVDTEFDVARGPGRAFIRADGRVVVSLFDNTSPQGQVLYATYHTYGETGARSIFTSENEVLTLNSLNLRVVERGAT